MGDARPALLCIQPTTLWAPLVRLLSFLQGHRALRPALRCLGPADASARDLQVEVWHSVRRAPDDIAVTSSGRITLRRLDTREQPNDPITRRMSLAPAYIATGAVVLYALGVVASVGHIRASDLDVTQAFSLIPLERHLRTGVATLLSGPVLTVVGGTALAFGCLYFTLPMEERNASRKRHSGHPEATANRKARENVAMMGVAVWLAAMVFASLILPWTAAPVVFASLALIVMYARIQGRYAARKALAYYASAVLALTVVTAAAEALFAGDPLPRATVTTTKAPVTGALIAINDGVVYLGPRRKGDLYRSVPTSEVVRIDVQRRQRKAERSVLQMLGL